MSLVLVSKMSKRNSDFGVAPDETLIKISEPKERLNVFNLVRFRPVCNNLDFGRIHSEPIRPHKESQIFNRVNIQRTFFTVSEESMLSESSQDFADPLIVECQVVGVN
jgi:hypothetical protein